MPKDWKCPFCGSKTPMVETPYVELDGKGNRVHKTTPCCRWQGANMKWQSRHENPITHEKPDLEGLSKWK